MGNKTAYVIIGVASLVAGWALLQPGLPPTHDGEYHVVRFYEFFQTFSMGQWYPRWAYDLNDGYGVPLFNYVYPFPNYIALFLHTFGVSFIDAFKLNMFLAIFVGAFFMYLWASLYWAVDGGIVAAIFYTFAPYHFLDIYIRGSVGEVWALAFFPAFLWSITKLVKEDKMLFLALSSIFLALIIFSHNILALMFFPFAISYGLVVARDTKKSLFSSVLMGLGLSSIFWLPALFERDYVRGLEIFDYRAHFVQIYQLIFPSWGSGFSADPATEGLSFQIGLAHLGVFCVAILLLIFAKKKIDLRIKFFMLIWISISIFLMLPASSYLWDKLPLIQYFQFPWRFLSLVILCISFLAGSIVQQKKSKIILGFLIALPVAFAIGYTKPAYYHMRDDMYYVTRSNFIDGTNSPGDTFNTIWFKGNLPKAETKAEQSDTATRINKAYFPGWRVFVDGKEVSIRPSKGGLIEITKVDENAAIDVQFEDTFVRAFARWFSLLTFFAMLFLFLLRYHDIILSRIKRKT